MFYLDENFGGNVVTDFLKSAGIAVVTANDLGFQGAFDYIWIPEVTKQNYIIVTKDQRVRYVPAEKQAIVLAGARVIVLTGKGRAINLAENFVNSRTVIERFISREQGPWIARLAMANDKDFSNSRSGRLTKVAIY